LSLIHNERTKLTANWLDRAGTAAVTIGVIAPIAAAVFGYGNPPFSTGRLAIGVAFWFLTGVALHLIARLLLKRLQP
jgi:uncharacterized membrane protein YdjX (TVP38/TMEM64 family)